MGLPEILTYKSLVPNKEFSNKELSHSQKVTESLIHATCLGYSIPALRVTCSPVKGGRGYILYTCCFENAKKLFSNFKPRHSVV